MSKRSTSLGCGNKYDFFKEKPRSPSPSLYDTSQDINHSKGKSFGYGRNVKRQLIQEIKTNSYINPEGLYVRQLNIQTPRVGQYQDSRISLKKKSPSSFLISKHKEDHFIQPNNTPDPALYNPSDTFMSRRKRSTKFGFGKAERFNYQKIKEGRMIGPGSYNNQNKGVNKNSSRATIGHAIHKTYAVEAIERSISPGPKYYAV